MLKKIVILILLLLLLAALYIFYVCNTTGFFRDIKDDNRYVEVQRIPMYGGEDITIVNDSIYLASADHRLATINGEPEQGNIHLLKIVGENISHKIISANFKKEFHPHGIDVYNLSDTTARVLVVNHTSDGKHAIEEFILQNEELKFVKTYEHEHILSPNDVVIIDKEKFFFTNDHGGKSDFSKFIEENTMRRWAHVIYYNGITYSKVSNGIAYANGINFDVKRNLLYVASPREFLVKVYQPALDGQLEFVEDIPCGTGVDNIEIDDNGKLWIGCHPNLLQFVAYMASKKQLAPTEVITIDYRSKGDYTVESIYENDGSVMTSCSVARPFGNKMIIGTVADDHISIMSKK